MRLKIDHLSLADPKALRYVLHTSGYHFPKGREVDQNIKLVLGTGILCAPSTWIVMVFTLIMLPLIFCRHGPPTPEEDYDSGIPCSSAQNIPSLVPGCCLEGKTSALTQTYCTRIKEDLRLSTADPEVEGRNHFLGPHRTACHQRDHVALPHNPGHHW